MPRGGALSQALFQQSLVELERELRTAGCGGRVRDGASAKGLATAQLALSNAYSTGNGVAKNPKLAVQWCEKAAEQGYTKAQIALPELQAVLK